MRYLYCILLLWLPMHLHAQDDVFSNSNTKVRGFVRFMKVRSDMVRMVDDTLVYGENNGIHTYVFDDDSRIIADTSITDFRHDTTCYHYNYDKEGRLISIQNRHDTSSYDHNVTYTYTADDKIAEMYTGSKKGERTSTVSYQYHKDSVQVIHVYNFNKEYKNEFGYFYDDKGNVVTIKSYIDGKLTSTHSLEYDAFNNPVRQKIYDAAGKVEFDYTYEYIYDEHHNFTQRFAYRFKQPYNITKRVITYQ